MPYRIKEYVSIFMTPEIIKAIDVVDTVLHSYGLHAYITSGNDGKHSKNSWHYRNRAVDFRVVDWEPYLGDILDAVNRNLGDEYDVVFETNHLHVEYDPK